MKKSNFVAMILGTIGGVFFALGMCMGLLPQWELFNEGIVLGILGLIIGLVTLLVWRKMEHKPPIRITGKNIGCTLLGVVGTLGFGVGMCMAMEWDMMVQGTLVGLVGIVCLLSLIPIVKGIRSSTNRFKS